MPVEVDANGRRSVRVEVQVPGERDAVWRAVATGPGVSSWFVPTRLEEDAEGRPLRWVHDFGPGMESVATITEWDPLDHFTTDSADLGPDAPMVASRWSVEDLGGGRSTVAVEHAVVASTDEWDVHLQAWESGWPDFFRILRLYLTHFPGAACAPVQLQATTPLTVADAWARLVDALGFGGVAAGDELKGVAGAPPLRASVERIGEAVHPEELLLRLHVPAPGVLHLFAMKMGERTLISLRLLFYGGAAQDAARGEEPRWRAWLAREFPAEPSGDSS